MIKFIKKEWFLILILLFCAFVFYTSFISKDRFDTLGKAIISHGEETIRLRNDIQNLQDQDAELLAETSRIRSENKRLEKINDAFEESLGYYVGEKKEKRTKNNEHIY